MNKPKLLYASPFPPKQSGISDYSVALVMALSGKFDITLYTDDYRIEEDSLAEYPVLKHGVDEIPFEEFPYIIYNIGNNPYFHSYIYEACLEHPGMVILHDLVIYYLFAGYYESKGQKYTKIYQEAGAGRFFELKEMVREGAIDSEVIAKLYLNGEILRSGNKIMVHSRYSYDHITETGYTPKELLRKINLISLEEPIREQDELRKNRLYEKYNIPEDALVIASFGNIHETKLNHNVCRVVKKMAAGSDRKICYVMVGRGISADEYLEPGLVIKTDYVELDEYQDFMNYADIIVNLRYPSMGETSAAMVQIMRLGKPCITNNGGWFSELPESAVCKIALDDVEGNLETVLEKFVSNPEERENLGKAARAYFEQEYSPEVITEQIYEFLTEKR